MLYAICHLHGEKSGKKSGIVINIALIAVKEIRNNNMDKKTEKLASILTYCGILPFILLAIASATKFYYININFIAISYGSMILSFLSGTHWAAHIFFPDKCPRYLLISSNLTALIAFGSIFILSNEVSFIIQALCFIYILFLDYKFYTSGVMPKCLYELRCNATLVVIAMITYLTILA